MNSWTDVKPGLIAILATLTDVPAVNIVWKDQARPFINPGDGTSPPAPGTRAQILCSIENVVTQGYGDWETVFLGFSSSVVASAFQGTVTAGQPLWFTENAPAPFVTNTKYFAVAVGPSSFGLAAMEGGTPIAPTLASSTGAVLSTAPPGQELQDTLSGILNFDLVLRCESLEQEDGLTASEYLEQIRRRSDRKSTTDAMLAINCAFYDSTPTQDVSLPADSRMVSAAVLTLNVRSNYSEVDGAAYGYIASVSSIQGPTP